MNGPLVRVGIEGSRAPVLRMVRELGAPVLISANSLWKRGRFVVPGNLGGLDVALDSGGFVAMKRYGGFRWSAEQYATLARDLAPSWWAQMDFCCEPELGGRVSERIDRTVAGLLECQSAAARLGMPAPMPVLQGWAPADYCQGPAFDPSFVWPELVGVGSVCRRPVSGACGVLSVVDALDRAVPRHVRFHLFGVKSGAMAEILKRWPNRLASVDSMAWNMAARWDALHSGESCTCEFRAERLGAWYRKQAQSSSAPAQSTLDL